MGLPRPVLERVSVPRVVRRVNVKGNALTLPFTKRVERAVSRGKVESRQTEMIGRKLRRLPRRGRNSYL
jgi:hypothetical protein